MATRTDDSLRRSAAMAALRLAAGYVAVAVTWIVASDSLVALLPVSFHERAQTLKGLAFVAVTGIVLYVLVLRWARRVRREARHAMSAEQLLTHIVQTVPVGVLLVSDDGLITFVNPAAESLLGMGMGEAVGLTFDEIEVFGRSEESVKAAELLRGSAVHEFHIEIASPRAERAVVAQAARADAQRPESGWVVAISDVTDVQEARDRSARLVKGYRYLSQAAITMTRAASRRALLEAVARLAIERGGFVGAWVLYQHVRGEVPVETAFHSAGDPPCGDVGHMPQAYAPDGEFLPRLVHGEIQVSNDVANDPRSPWYSCAQTQGWGSAASLALSAPDDMVVVLVLFGSSAGYFDVGQVELLESVRSSLAFALDRLTLDRRRLEAEEALALSERSYRTMFEVHPQPMWVYDIESLRFLAVNDSAVAKYGFSRDEFAAMTIADIRPRDEVPRLLRNVVNVSDGLDDAGIWTHIDKNGREFPVHIYSHVLDWEGRHAELVMVMEVARVE